MSYSVIQERLLQQCFQIEEEDFVKPPKFEDLRISVSTYMVKFLAGTNFDIENIFYKIPVLDIPLEVIKKKDSLQILTIADPSSILLAKYKDKHRGNVEVTNPAFRNQVTLIMSISEKNVNIFVFRDCIKITGVQNVDQIIETVNCFVAQIQRLNRYHHCYDIDPVVIDYYPVMTNVNFQLGFKIDREALDHNLLHNGYISIYEPSINSGVYLKIPRPNFPDKLHTFTIFHTGRVLCSFNGDDLDEMKQIYNHVVDLLFSLRNDIRKTFI